MEFLVSFCLVKYTFKFLSNESRLSTTRATLISLFCTMFEVFDVPVYWPILVCYFFALFLMTMRRQIQYVPTSIYPLFEIPPNMAVYLPDI